MPTDIYGHALCSVCGFPIRVNSICTICSADTQRQSVPFETTESDVAYALALCQERFGAEWAAQAPPQQARRLANILRQYHSGERCPGCLLGEHAQ